MAARADPRMNRMETIAPEAGSTPTDSIAVVVLTHNRVHLLQKCVENVLLRTSDATREIVIWDNASPDATAEYLRSLDDPRIRVVISEKNIGQNAYARAFRMTTADYFIELDDDVVNAPEHWDAMMLDAFKKLPDVGFLAADLEDDPHDLASKYRHHIRPHEYQLVEENGVRLLTGPAGGGCAMTSRELNERAGGFREDPKQVFWLEDEAYIGDIAKLGYRSAVMADLRVHHTGGPHYTVASKEKVEYWERYKARRARRAAVKRALYRVPLVPRLNAHFGWFVAPS
jgi:GT2 family glycosyltransferase